jgi:hypothetical protein
MSVTNGLDLDYTADQLVGANGSTILRRGFTGDSKDRFPSTQDLITAEFGDALSSVGQSFSVTIANDTTNDKIILSMGEGQVLLPSSSFLVNQDIILSGTAKTYLFVVQSSTTASVFLQSSAVGFNKTGLVLGSANLLVGDSDNVARPVSLSGEGLLDNAGVFTLGSVIAGKTQFANAEESTNATTGALVTLGGLGVGGNIFSAQRMTANSGFQSGSTILSNGTVTGLDPPLGGTDAVSKNYVDNLIQGLSWKTFVRALQSTNIKVLENLVTVDNISIDDGNRVLLVGQELPEQNGIWVVQAGKAWVRPLDFENGDVAASSSLFVSEGDEYGDTAWVCTNDRENSVIGTDGLTFVVFNNGTLAINSINGQSGPVITIETSDIGNDFQIRSKANVIQVCIPSADSTSRGLVTFGEQRFGGAKGFDSIQVDESIKLGAKDTVTLFVPPVLESYNLFFPPAQGNDGDVMQNDGTGQLFFQKPFVGALNLWYGYGPPSDEGFELTNAPTPVTITTKLQKVQDFGALEGVVTIPSTGYYKVAYWAQFKSSGNQGGSRGSLASEIYVKRDTTFELENGSTASCYLRSQNNSTVQPGCGKTLILLLNTNDQLQLFVRRLEGSVSAEIVTEQCNLSLDKISNE